MSDRSYMFVEFDVDLPVDVVHAIMLIVEDDDVDTEDQYFIETRESGTIAIEEMVIGEDEPIHEALLALVAGGITDDTGIHHPVADFAWSVRQDPKYNYDGAVRKHTPGRPDFIGTTSGDGTIVIDKDKVDAIVAATTTFEELVSALDGAFGVGHKF